MAKIKQGLSKPGIKADDKSRYLEMYDHCGVRGKAL